MFWLLLVIQIGKALPVLLKLPFSISMNRYWQLPSWDKIQIPKPFARVVVVIGQPIKVADDATTHEAKHQELQQALENLRAESDALIR